MTLRLRYCRRCLPWLVCLSATTAWSGCAHVPFGALLRPEKPRVERTTITDATPVDVGEDAEAGEEVEPPPKSAPSRSAKHRPGAANTGDSAATLLRTAREMEAHGDDRAAIEQYERLLELHPNEPGVVSRLARLYERIDEAERAAEQYAAALDESPDDADLWSDYAEFERKQGRHDEAEEAARTAVEIDSEHQRAWVSLGLILAERGRFDDAHRAFAEAVGEAAAHNNLGIILARQGRIAEARKRLAEAQRLDPTLRQPQAVLATLDRLEGRAARKAGGNEDFAEAKRSDERFEREADDERSSAHADIATASDDEP